MILSTYQGPHLWYLYVYEGDLLIRYLYNQDLRFYRDGPSTYQWHVCLSIGPKGYNFFFIWDYIENDYDSTHSL